MIAPVQGAMSLVVGAAVRGDDTGPRSSPLTLTLLPQRAVWCEAVRTLMVADVHIGKGLSFRRLGVPVPHGTTATNLARLASLMQHWSAQRLVILGDFLHAARSHAPSTHQALAQWRERFAAVEMVLVRGNHDDRAGDPPAWLNMPCVDEPWMLPGTPLALCHHPQTVEGAFALAGHVHPSVTIHSGFERLRLPCFQASEQRLIVPAFGEFTGTHGVARVPGERLFAVTEDRVVAV
jgi:uncharacterized protein